MTKRQNDNMTKRQKSAKTKRQNNKTKKKVQYCEVRAVSHSCDVLQQTLIKKDPLLPSNDVNLS